MKISHCCGAKVYPETDICQDCKEHCTVYYDEYTYEAVGEDAGLFGDTFQRFVAYMETRWPDDEEVKCRVGYAREWAERFKAGVEYAASDREGQRVLKGRPLGEEPQ